MTMTNHPLTNNPQPTYTTIITKVKLSIWIVQLRPVGEHVAEAEVRKVVLVEDFQKLLSVLRAILIPSTLV